MPFKKNLESVFRTNWKMEDKGKELIDNYLILNNLVTDWHSLRFQDDHNLTPNSSIR